MPADRTAETRAASVQLHGKLEFVASFPRLSSVFGVPLTELDAIAIQAAIGRSEVEDQDLDWKAEHYPRNKNFELAKDVAALANTVGGAIFIGVRERAGRAVESTPVVLTGDLNERVHQILASRVKPLLPGIDVREIPISHGSGYVIIIVPRSYDAPHAVVDDRKGGALHYPVRIGRTTHYLTEHQVAVRYRDRYAARADIVNRLDQVSNEGLSRIALYASAFLGVTLVPAIPGQRGIGAVAVAAEQRFLDGWSADLATPTAPFPSGIRVVPGLRRVTVNQAGQYERYAKEPQAELHYDGAGFAATNCMTPMPETRDPSDPPDGIEQDMFELALLDLVLFLGHHAVDCGASGECILRAQLHPSQQTGTATAPVKTQIVAPSTALRNAVPTEYFDIPESRVLNSTHSVETSASLDELVSDVRFAVITAHALAADILGEFGIPEPNTLRPDGNIDVRHVVRKHRIHVEPWVTERNLLA